MNQQLTAFGVELGGAPFSMVLAVNPFTDADAWDTLRYTATLADDTALPSWLQFDKATQTFSGTPGASNVGNISIKVVATDGAGATASSLFSINVLADPQAGDDTLTADTNNTPLHGGGGNDKLTGSWASSTLFGDRGDDVLIASGGPSNYLDGGDGNDTLTGGWGQDTLIGGDGNDTITAVGGNSIIRGGAGDDKITSSWGADNIDAGAGDDIIRAGGGGNTIRAGLGNDTIISDQWSDDKYLFARGDGHDSLLDAGGQDMLTLENVRSDQLWFTHVGNDLELSVIGTQDHITLRNWYLGAQYPGAQYHMDKIKASDGKMLLDGQVQALVQAMASFAPPAAGQTTLSPEYATALAPVLAANWH